MTYHVGLDGAVGGGVGDAGEGEAGAHLVVVEEGLVGLVDGTRGDLARAGRARARAARVGEVDAGLLLVSGDSGSGGRGQRGSSSSAATIDAFSRRLSIGGSRVSNPRFGESRPIRGLREARVRSDAITRARTDRRARLDAGAAFFARQSSYLGGVEHVGVVGALDLLGALGGLEGDLVGHDGHAAGLGRDGGLGAEGRRPAVKAEAFTVMAFMVTADIVVFGLVVGVCDGRGSVVAGARERSEKPDARTDKP